MIRKEVLPGTNLDEVIQELLKAKEKGESVYCYFNGHKLCSDTISMDSAYMEVLGKTKADYDRETKEYLENFERRKKEEGEKAKANVLNWIERGKALIFPERYDEWEKCVINRASDLSHGEDLDKALEIMTALENGASIEEATQMLNEQDDIITIRRILFSFSSQGPEFCEATAFGRISQAEKELIEAKKKENIQLIQNNQPKANKPKL